MTTLKLIQLFAIFLAVLPLVKGDDDGAYCSSGYVTGVSDVTSFDYNFTCSDGSQPVSFNHTSSTLPQYISDLQNLCGRNDVIVVGFFESPNAKYISTSKYNNRLCEKSSVFDLDVLTEIAITQGDSQSYQCPPNSSFIQYRDATTICASMQTKSPLVNAVEQNSHIWCSEEFFTSLTPDLTTGNGNAQCLWNINAKSIPPEGPLIVNGTSAFTPVSALINTNSANGITTNVTTFACGAGEAAYSIFYYYDNPPANDLSPSSVFQTIFTGAQQFYCDQVHLSQGYSLIPSVSSNPSSDLSFYCPNGFLSGLSQISTTMSDGSSTINYSYTCVTPVPPIDPLASGATSESNNTGTGSNENQQSDGYVKNGNDDQSTTYQGSPQGQGNYGTYQSGAQQGQVNYGTSQSGAQQGQGNYGTSQTGAQQGQNSYGNLGSYKNIANVYSSNASIDVVSSSLLSLIMVYLIAILN